MSRIRFRRFVTPFVIALAVPALLCAQNAQQNAVDVDRIVTALQLQSGSIVGEIGAGDGALTLGVARAVGDAGRVFSNEFNQERLAAIRTAAEQAGVKNVTVVEAREAETNFPEQCCDALFMRNVYHHFGDPQAMNMSLFRSLKPEGRLAILDFGPPGAESSTPSRRGEDGQHGVTPATVERELKTAGFEILSSTALPFGTFMIVARRPAPDCLEEVTAARSEDRALRIVAD
jgi:ubiquinone/menaquinone biosynthesis C-methylase UbiE